MTGRELKRSARKPWQPIAALLGISFTMPSTAASSSTSATPLGTATTVGPPTSQPSGTSTIVAAAPFDMSTTGSGNSRQASAGSNQSSSPIVIPPGVSGSPAMSSRTSGNSHH